MSKPENRPNPNGPFQVVIYVRREDVEAGRVRGYVHPKAMGAGLMAMNGEREWFKGETTDQAAQRLDRDGWVPLVAELTLVGYVRSSAVSIVVTEGKE